LIPRTGFANRQLYRGDPEIDKFESFYGGISEVAMS